MISFQKNVIHPLTVALMGIVAILFLGSCSEDEVISRVIDGGSETSTRPELIQEILTEGGLVLPLNAEVLLAHYEHGIDTAYRIALRMSPQDVTTFLTNSHITTPPIQKTTSNEYSEIAGQIAGPNIDSSPSLLKIRDSRPDKPYIYRTVWIDQRDDTNHYIHISFAT
ncbi:MAG: hypothetical protein ACRCSF_10640 [Mycobacteriaceae bacterium]